MARPSYRALKWSRLFSLNQHLGIQVARPSEFSMNLLMLRNAGEWFLVPFSWRCSRQPLSCSEIKPKTSTRQGEKQESTNFGGSFKFLAFLSTYPFQRWLELVGPDWCALRWVGGRVQNFRTRICFHKHWLTGCAIFQTLSQWYLSIFPDHYWFAIGI